jgi:hypothetical protein
MRCRVVYFIRDSVTFHSLSSKLYRQGILLRKTGVGVSNPGLQSHHRGNENLMFSPLLRRRDHRKRPSSRRGRQLQVTICIVYLTVHLIVSTGRNAAPTPSVPSPAAQNTPRAVGLNAHRSPVSTSGSSPIATQRTPNTNTRNVAYKEPSKLSQRPALTQSSFSAKTKVKRNKQARETLPSSDSSELPESIFPIPTNGKTSWKKVKPLALAAERKKRGFLPTGSPETRTSRIMIRYSPFSLPAPGKSSGSKSLKGTAPKQFIGLRPSFLTFRHYH